MDERTHARYMSDVAYFLTKMESEPNSGYFIPLALAYNKLEKYDETIAMCKTAIERYPANCAAKTFLAEAYVYKGQFDEARDLLFDVTAEDDNNYKALKLLGIISKQNEETSEAIKYLTGAYLRSPEDSEIIKMLEELGATIDPSEIYSERVKKDSMMAYEDDEDEDLKTYQAIDQKIRNAEMIMADLVSDKTIMGGKKTEDSEEGGSQESVGVTVSSDGDNISDSDIEQLLAQAKEQNIDTEVDDFNHFSDNPDDFMPTISQHSDEASDRKSLDDMDPELASLLTEDSPTEKKVELTDADLSDDDLNALLGNLNDSEENNDVGSDEILDNELEELLISENTSEDTNKEIVDDELLSVLDDGQKEEDELKTVQADKNIDEDKELAALLSQEDLTEEKNNEEDNDLVTLLNEGSEEESDDLASLLNQADSVEEKDDEEDNDLVSLLNEDSEEENDDLASLLNQVDSTEENDNEEADNLVSLLNESNEEESDDLASLLNQVDSTEEKDDEEADEEADDLVSLLNESNEESDDLASLLNQVDSTEEKDNEEADDLVSLLNENNVESDDLASLLNQVDSTEEKDNKVASDLVSILNEDDKEVDDDLSALLAKEKINEDVINNDENIETDNEEPESVLLEEINGENSLEVEGDSSLEISTMNDYDNQEIKDMSNDHEQKDVLDLDRSIDESDNKEDSIEDKENILPKSMHEMTLEDIISDDITYDDDYVENSDLGESAPFTQSNIMDEILDATGMTAEEITEKTPDNFISAKERKLIKLEKMLSNINKG